MRLCNLHFYSVIHLLCKTRIIMSVSPDRFLLSKDKCVCHYCEML